LLELICTSFEDTGLRMYGRGDLFHWVKTVFFRIVKADVFAFYFASRNNCEELWVSIGSGHKQSSSQLVPLLWCTAQKNLRLCGPSTHSQGVTLRMVLFKIAAADAAW